MWDRVGGIRGAKPVTRGTRPQYNDYGASSFNPEIGGMEGFDEYLRRRKDPTRVHTADFTAEDAYWGQWAKQQGLDFQSRLQELFPGSYSSDTTTSTLPNILRELVSNNVNGYQTTGVGGNQYLYPGNQVSVSEKLKTGNMYFTGAGGGGAYTSGNLQGGKYANPALNVPSAGNAGTMTSMSQSPLAPNQGVNAYGKVNSSVSAYSPYKTGRRRITWGR